MNLHQNSVIIYHTQFNFFALEEDNMIPQELLRQKSKIMKSNPNSQTISYNINTWRKRLGSNPYFGVISNNFPGEISRSDLFQLAAQAKQSNDLNDIMILFISTMIWGYGTTGYGAWRTSEMLSSPNAEDIIKQTFELIISNNIIDSYNIQRLKRWHNRANLTVPIEVHKHMLSDPKGVI